MTEKNIYRLQHRIKALSEKAQRLSMERLGVALTILVCWALLGTAAYSQIALAVGAVLIVAFVVIVRAHSRVKRNLQLMKGRMAVAERQNATRLLEWSRLPQWQAQEKDKSLPYLTDLNIVGEFSLLRLIDQTVSDRGREVLYNLFLSNSATDAEIQNRTQTVQEMIKLRALRNIFLSHLQSVNEPINLRRVSALADEKLSSVRTPWEFLLIAVVQLALLIGIGKTLFGGSSQLALMAFIAVMVENMRLRKRLKTSEAYGWSLSAVVSLEGFRKAVQVLERYSKTPKQNVGKILAPFKKESSASHYIRKLDTIAGALGTRQNVIVHGLLHILFPWDIFWTYRLESVRKKIHEKLPLWEEALAQFEAFLSLAMYAETNTGFCTAEVATDKKSVIQAEDLRHPLILSQVAIGNPLSIDETEKCILLTGSNMSGKSTFLRSAGLNFLMAKAGLPVAASRFVFANIPLMTSLSAADSLHEGLSSFYGEVRRLKNILEVSEQTRSVFFLVDEIFRGTNNRERLLGSQAYIKALVNAGGKGMVTSHDLELAQLEGQNLGISNYHFKESIEDGRMSFAYKKNRGPCPTTNALMVMKLNGLPIE